MELVGGLVLWLVVGVACLPITGGNWLKDFPEEDGLPTTLMVVNAIVGPISIIICLMLTLFDRSKPRIGWLYGVRNGETYPSGKWEPAFCFGALLFCAMFLGIDLMFKNPGNNILDSVGR